MLALIGVLLRMRRSLVVVSEYSEICQIRRDTGAARATCFRSPIGDTALCPPLSI
jgi:hypothetical protein